ncbi:MAG: hypothetical protein AAF652_17115, partial [Cyanobacteria bacterium P01_C01_bin.72]
MKLSTLILLSSYLLLGFTACRVNAQETKDSPEASQLDIPPAVIESSPTLQRWLEAEPDLLEDIKRDPAFLTRFRVGFTTFPSSNNASGLSLG